MAALNVWQPNHHAGHCRECRRASVDSRSARYPSEQSYPSDRHCNVTVAAYHRP
ncbi:hypothetical protein ZHAS_00012675 [Anopheles sinensis]|uniref:Uncharacterized protein n=1 Tax=Anopheles sinensis TaxID=74873 RepID=A0A084W3G5_ANOSI|nr:hypothetical protein ZHAS_00012675 [Anopheles sinensis]